MRKEIRPNAQRKVSIFIFNTYQIKSNIVYHLHLTLGASWTRLLVSMISKSLQGAAKTKASKLNSILVRTLKVGRYIQCSSDQVRSTTTLRYADIGLDREPRAWILERAKKCRAREDACDISQPPTTPCFAFSSNSSHASRDLIVLRRNHYASLLLWYHALPDGQTKLHHDVHQLCKRKLNRKASTTCYYSMHTRCRSIMIHMPKKQSSTLTIIIQYHSRPITETHALGRTPILAPRRRRITITTTTTTTTLHRPLH